MLSDSQKRAAYDQYGHAGVDPNMAGAGAQGFGGFADAFGDIFGDIFGQAAGGGARGRGRSAGLSRRRSALQHGNHAGAGRARLRHADSRAELGELRCLQRFGREARHQAGNLPDLSRPGYGAHVAGLFQHPADLPEVPRHRQLHSRTVRALPRRGQGEGNEDAGSEDSGRHRRRHAHSLRRQRRAGHQRRPERRSVRRDSHQAARGVRARRRRSPLPDADSSSPRRRLAAKSKCRRSPAARASRCRKARSRARRSGLRGKGIKGLRSSIAGDLYVHVQVETPVKLTDPQRDLLKQFEKSLTEGGSRHSPQSKSWFDRVKSFFD